VTTSQTSDLLPGSADAWRRSLLPDDLLDTWYDRARAALPGSDVPRVFRACLARTIHRSLIPDGDEVAVITGDIPAMWLRDSSTQLWPYLSIVAEDPHGRLADAIGGVLRRQLRLIARDPYANAFNVRPDGHAHDSGDRWGDHPADPHIWERKYEVDSLCFPVQLLARFVELTGRRELLDGLFLDTARSIVDTLRRERHHEERSSYRFERPGGNALDTLTRGGRGSETAFTGMTWSGFRPSDDACAFGYNVPANLHAAAALGDLASLVAPRDAELAADARRLAEELRVAVARHGVVEHPRFGEIWAYEVDGLGSHLLMDDANLPSLLSLPIVAGIDRSDPLYRRTRAFVLSSENPTFTHGSRLSGVGSPHTWPGWVWPLALAAEGLTAERAEDAVRLMETIAATTGATDHIHESVDADDDARFTRPWFSWADATFCQLVISVVAPERYVAPDGPSR
jgi:meiotically up-regulated gene 157 (Mug157) protein